MTVLSFMTRLSAEGTFIGMTLLSYLMLDLLQKPFFRLEFLGF